MLRLAGLRSPSLNMQMCFKATIRARFASSFARSAPSPRLAGLKARPRFYSTGNSSASQLASKKPWVAWASATSFAVLAAGVQDGDGDNKEDPDGKTKTEKVLEVSRKQVDEALLAEQNKRGRLIGWFLRNIWEPALTLLRFTKLFALFLPLLGSGLPVAIGFCTDSYRALWCKYLVFTLQAAGPSFIKLGQWAASRTDIFPKYMCEAMAKLHSKARQHSMAHTRKAISDAFEKPFAECFEEFDEEPLGVGAMAQVYRAVLKSDEYEGEVAVKVLHPNVESIIRRDLRIMMFFAKTINALPTMEWLSLPGEVETFGRMMQSQLDLRIEAENLETFRHNFAEEKDVSFPKPSLKATSRQVLVEQMVKGVSMEKVLKYVRHTEFDKRVAALGLDAFLSMLLLHDFIHSDLHAGNIFLSVDGEDHKVEQLKRAKTQEEWDAVWGTLNDASPHLWFIDAGLVTELNPTNQANFVALFKAIATFDGYRAGELMVERSRTPETVINKDLFALKTESLVNRVKKRTFALGSVSIGDLLSKMMEMVREHHVRMESDFITVVLSILLLEGIGRRLDPDLDIFKSALPVLRRVSQHKAVHVPGETFSFEDTVQMLKVWVVLETRQFITASVQDIYRCVKYDRLSPNT